jgi:hypothetical protein
MPIFRVLFQWNEIHGDSVDVEANTVIEAKEQVQKALQERGPLSVALSRETYLSIEDEAIINEIYQVKKENA